MLWSRVVVVRPSRGGGLGGGGSLSLSTVVGPCRSRSPKTWVLTPVRNSFTLLKYGVWSHMHPWDWLSSRLFEWSRGRCVGCLVLIAQSTIWVFFSFFFCFIVTFDLSFWIVLQITRLHASIWWLSVSYLVGLIFSTLLTRGYYHTQHIFLLNKLWSFLVWV